MSFMVFGQNDLVVINGKVTEFKSNESLQYVNIYFKNIKIGTVSNNNGEFILYVKKNELPDTLIFSLIGYFSKKIYIDISKNELNINVSLMPKIEKLNTVIIKEKKIEPKKILEKVYDYYSKRSKQKYKVQLYVRDYIKLNQAFIYGTKAFMEAHISNKISLYEKCKILSANLKVNDSLLFLYSDTPSVLDLPNQVLSYNFSLKNLQKHLKNKTVSIDTVMYNNDGKIYVMDVNCDCCDKLPSNYKLILNDSIAFDFVKNINKYLENAQKTSIKSYRIYLEFSNNKYLIKKLIRYFLGYSIKSEKMFYKIEYDFTTLDERNIIPYHKSIFTSILQNDSVAYYDFNEFIITKVEKVNKIDKKKYKLDYLVLPSYTSDRISSESKKKFINRYNDEHFNYIKEDSLEILFKDYLK